MTYCPVWDYYSTEPGNSFMVLCSNPEPNHLYHWVELTHYHKPGIVHCIKDNRSKEEQYG